MKRLFLMFITGSILMASFIGCSEDPPSVRVYNERATKANVQVKSSTGNTINLNDVLPGQTVKFQEITEGLSETNAVIQDESVSPTATFVASNDYKYTIVVANTTPPTIRIDSDKQ
jgi:hypothetical protein